MPIYCPNRFSRLIALGAVAVLLAAVLCADSPVTTPPSRYALTADLQNQIAYFLQRLRSDLSDQAAYGEDQQGRVERDASTVAAIGLVLGIHDKDHALKKSAPAIIAAAGELAANAGDFDEAKASLKTLELVLVSAANGQTMPCEPVADLAVLMQQVPIVNNSLRRGVNSRRFRRIIDRTAGLAATLAAISQASMIDLAYCGDEESEKKWQAICAEMRDAAAEVNAAVRRRDQAAAKMGLKRVAKTCDACHHEFRD